MNDKKNNFGMWLFSDGVMKTLNWFAVILIIVWFGYHGLRFVLGFRSKVNRIEILKQLRDEYKEKN